MNRKFEDKLAELAFGDLAPEEASRLERAAQDNPEAQRTLSMYRDMRAGLKGLSDIPDDQFSKERLRDAILTQGLKPVAPRHASPRAWLWMPCAALLIGFAYTVVRQNMLRSSAAPEIVMGPSALKGTPLTTTIEPTRVATNTVTSPLIGAMGPSRSTELSRSGDRNSNTDEVPPDKVIVHDFNGQSGEDPGYGGDDLGDDSLGGSTAADTPPQGTRFGPHSGTSLTASSGKKPATGNVTAANSGPVVLIDQNKDEQTGAEEATEVSSASNVLIGG